MKQIAFAMCAVFFGQICLAQDSIQLAGAWRFRLDAADAGINSHWFSQDLSDKIELPGSLPQRHIGDAPSAQTRWTARIGMSMIHSPQYQPYQEAGHYQSPFWLTPPTYYVGAAWYQRDITIPPAWADRRVTLFLERPHWETQVWLDDHALGMQNSLGTPHSYDLTQFAAPGNHRLTIRVDNTIKIPVGADAHSVSDQTQGNWNGLVGKIELRSSDKVWISDAQVYPNTKAGRIRMKLAIGNRTGATGSGTVSVGAESYPVTWSADGGATEIDYALPADAKPWDEFSPNMQQLEVRLKSDDGRHADQKDVTFGLRDLATKGTQFTLNGRPIFLRGTLECCIFPQTGYPPTDIASWKRIMTIARSFGLNHLRFHSWCPPEAAFEAADDMGFYLSVECSCWAQFGGASVDDWVTAEGQRMLKAYGNHPSFMFMVPSNEPNRQDPGGFLNGLIAAWAKQDSRHLYTAGSGWPSVANNQYRVASPPRLQGSHELTKPPQTSSDYTDFITANSVPVVSHEIGQWCAYPDFTEIPKFNGVMQAGNLAIFQGILNKSGMGDQAHDFTMATGKLQAMLYKEEIEEALRTPGMGGFQLLDLHDFPGQGTAPVGVLDAFWDEKGYISAQQYHRFCGPTVPLARMKTRVFTSDQTLNADIEVAHFGPDFSGKIPVSWRIRDTSGKAVIEGTLPAATITSGTQTQLGAVSARLESFKTAAKLDLEVTVGDFSNDWDFWVYPPAPASPPVVADTVHVTEKWDADAKAFVSGGGRLLLLPDPKSIAGDTVGAFEPIFWNRVTFPPRPGQIHAVGLLCDVTGATLAEFPTDSYQNWQWWDLLQNSKPMILDSLPKQLKPAVQVIDDWNVCRKLGLVVEGRVGKGRLIICSIDLAKDLQSRPVARQLRGDLIDYAAGNAFNPQTDLTAEQVDSLLVKPAP